MTHKESEAAGWDRLMRRWREAGWPINPKKVAVMALRIIKELVRGERAH